MIGALAWAAVPWVRVTPPDDAVVVTLLAGAEQPGARAATPDAGAIASAPPAAEPASGPAAVETAEKPTARPSSAAAARPPKAEPRPPARAAPSTVREAARAEPEPPAGAGEAAEALRAGAAGSDAAATAAALVPGAGGARDAGRVYGEGEVDRAAAPVGGLRRPEYPARERMLGRESRVALLVTIDAAGEVREVAVTRSGGEAFDRAARRAIEATPFRAARVADRPVPSKVTVEVRFELD